MPGQIRREPNEAVAQTLETLASSIRPPYGASTRFGHQRSASAMSALPIAKAEVSSRVPTRLATFAKPQLATPRKQVMADTPGPQQSPIRTPLRPAGKLPEKQPTLKEDKAAQTATAENMGTRQMAQTSRNPTARNGLNHTYASNPSSQSSQNTHVRPLYEKARKPSTMPTASLQSGSNEVKRTTVAKDLPSEGGDASRLRALHTPRDAQSQPGRIVSAPLMAHSPAVGQRPRGPSDSAVDASQRNTVIIQDSLSAQDSPLAKAVQRTPLLQSTVKLSTPSKIPRLNPVFECRASVSPRPGKGSMVSPTHTPAAIQSPPERILSPRVQELAKESVNGNKTAITEATTSSVPRRRIRKDSNISDIDDRLAQSMRRLPRTSGLSPGWSPQGELDLDSGRKAKDPGGRRTKQRPLANMVRPVKAGERCVLGSSVNAINIDTPLRSNNHVRTPEVRQIRIQDASLIAQLRQVNESLEQENLSFAFELAAMEAQAAQAEAARREAEMAIVWKDIAAALQRELAQLQRNKATRKRELKNFDNMVELAVMAV